MTIQDLGALGDMVGGIAVVASLIYLAAQIRQNTQQMSQNAESARLSALERNIESANRIREIFILHPDITDLFLNGLKSFDALPGRDRFRFDQLMRNTMTSFQGAYLRHLSIGGDPLEFASAGQLVDSLLRRPGARAWFEQGDFDWRPEFKTFLDNRLAGLNSDSGDSAKH